MNIKGTGGLNFMPTAELGRFMTTLLGCDEDKRLYYDVIKACLP
jgi:hypothetical protein